MAGRSWLSCLVVLLGVLTPLRGQNSFLLEELTWSEVRQALASGTDTVILPVGATEQHGPHIALSSDSVTGDWLAGEMARRLGGALVAPNIRVGISDHHLLFAGTLSVAPRTLQNLIADYVHSLAWHGFRHLVILPTHGGNFTAVGEVGRELSLLYPHLNIQAFSDASAYISALQAATREMGINPEAAGSHAGLSETAMILATRPDLVRMGETQAGFLGDAYGVGEQMTRQGTHAISPIGVLGDPREATPEAGRRYLQGLADLLVNWVAEGRRSWAPRVPEDLPQAGPPSPSGPLEEGIRLRRAGREGEALHFFLRYREAHPQDTRVALEMVRTYTLVGRWEEARRVLLPLLADPDPSRREAAHDEAALLDLYAGRFQSALRHKEQARRLREEAGDLPGQARKLIYMGHIRQESGRPEEAREAYLAALRLVPQVDSVHLDAQHLFGLLAVQTGALIEAQRALRVLGEASRTPTFRSQLRRFYHLNGEILLARGRHAEAILNLQSALRIYDHPLYRLSLASALEEAGRLAEAKVELEGLIQLQDARLDIPIHYVKAHYRLGRLLEKLNRPQEARRWLETFLDFWGQADTPLPEIADAQARLGR